MQFGARNELFAALGKESISVLILLFDSSSGKKVGSTKSEVGETDYQEEVIAAVRGIPATTK
jgi:hypothetical protein